MEKWVFFKFVHSFCTQFFDSIFFFFYFLFNHINSCNNQRLVSFGANEMFVPFGAVALNFGPKTMGCLLSVKHKCNLNCRYRLNHSKLKGVCVCVKRFNAEYSNTFCWCVLVFFFIFLLLTLNHFVKLLDPIPN